MEDDFTFEVGSVHENMKGVYEVISVNRDSMVIRWRNGEEIVTTVDQQKRILERMAYEKDVEDRKNAGNKKKGKA